uniref:Uncharacterized protein n=1 Tax=viral metagenome TaxID=1070528 RepID=A0A6H1ZBN0_9ZZZZ
MSIDWLISPLAKLAGDNKWLKSLAGIANPLDVGVSNIRKGYKTGGIRGAIGGLSDTAAFGAGDFISPLYTDKQGDNPIYDRIGPIMAGYWGGPLAGFAADKYAQGSKYSEVGDLSGGSLSSGIGSYTGANSWFTDIFKNMLSGNSDSKDIQGLVAGGDAGKGGSYQLSKVEVNNKPWYSNLFTNNTLLNYLSGGGKSLSGGGTLGEGLDNVTYSKPSYSNKQLLEALKILMSKTRDDELQGNEDTEEASSELKNYTLLGSNLLAQNDLFNYLNPFS